MLWARRYTARALHRILEQKYEGEEWPSQRFAVPSQTAELDYKVGVHPMPVGSYRQTIDKDIYTIYTDV